MINWYNGGLGRANKDQASIERGGNIAIGYDLLAKWPDGALKARVGYDRDQRVVYVQPETGPTPGALTIQMPKTDRRAARIAAAHAMKGFGLEIDKPVACEAQWHDGMLRIVLPDPGHGPRATGHEPQAAPAPSDERRATSDQGAEDSTTENTEATETEPADELQNASTLPRFHASTPPPATDRPARCCGNCIWQRCRQCQNQAAPEGKRNRLVSNGDVCDQHFYKTELRRPDEKDPRPPAPPCATVDMAKLNLPPQRAKWNGDGGPRRGRANAKLSTGSRPRGLCTKADHDGKTFPVSRHGIQPHDMDGVVYSAGRGDRTRRCPGSNQIPQAME